MSFLLRSRGARLALGVGLCAAGALTAPAGCLFPDYSFNEPEPTGGTTTSTGTNPENCANGVDDDDDGAIDCADTKCTDHACVPEVPTGWTGYFALYSGASAQDPGCPAAFPSTTTAPYVGNHGITAPPAECTCSCGPAQQQVCAALSTLSITVGDALCGQAVSCSGEFGPAPASWNGTCFNNGGFVGGKTTCGAGSGCTAQGGTPCTVSVNATPVTASGGSCQKSAVAVVLPDIKWATFGRACGDSGAPGAGCNIGQACLPKPEAPYESGVCISQDGDLSCPPGAFTEKHVLYAGVTDTRACTDDCSCGPPGGGTCPTMVSVYGTIQLNTCTNVVATFPAGSCVNLTGNPTVGGQTATALGAPTGGTCTESGGTPTGTATPRDPTTFCCIP